MDLLEIIKSRRSIMPHLFNNLTITNEEINLILEAANWAPTHKC
jgi:nitroreductase